MLDEKLNKIEVTFAIKDMENLSGIRVETIRMWESRYGVLKPKRTKTNIRSYDLDSLRKLLNLSLLIENGYKISKISKLGEEDLSNLVLELKLNFRNFNIEINALSIATINFDSIKFNEILDELIEKLTFDVTFIQIMVPFMNKVGILWQAKTIMAANEHFASNIIKQRLYAEIEKARKERILYHETLFVLFLPMNEIHELGLLFLQFKLLLMGFKCIYLGQSVPISNLKAFEKREEDVIYFMAATVSPKKETLGEYLNAFYDIVHLKPKDALWLTGRNTSKVDINKLPSWCFKFNDFESVIDALENMENSNKMER